MSKVYDWFQENVRGGKEVYDALVSAAASAEEEIAMLNATSVN